MAVASWHDGDTFKGCVDQGIGIFRGNGLAVVDGKVILETIRCRCALIQAPELDEPGGLAALAYAARLAPPGVYPCWTYKANDTFGRPKIDLILPGGLFSELMMEAGHAVRYRG